MTVVKLTPDNPWGVGVAGTYVAPNHPMYASVASSGCTISNITTDEWKEADMYNDGDSQYMAVKATRLARKLGYISKREAKVEGRGVFVTIRQADQVKGKAKGLRNEAKRLRREADRLDKLVK